MPHIVGRNVLRQKLVEEIKIYLRRVLPNKLGKFSNKDKVLWLESNGKLAKARMLVAAEELTNGK